MVCCWSLVFFSIWRWFTVKPSFWICLVKQLVRLINRKKQPVLKQKCSSRVFLLFRRVFLCRLHRVCWKSCSHGKRWLLCYSVWFTFSWKCIYSHFLLFGTKCLNVRILQNLQRLANPENFVQIRLYNPETFIKQIEWSNPKKVLVTLDNLIQKCFPNISDDLNLIFCQNRLSNPKTFSKYFLLSNPEISVKQTRLSNS